tara:strand:+ start:55 stop:483 length:429 start_codon:yes stop_codon:yes gene_type:complete
MTTTPNKRARGFGPKPKPLKELKLHLVPVRFNSQNLQILDGLRGKIPRSIWLHEAGLKQKPPAPAPKFPEVNREVWAELKQGPMSLMHQIKHEADRLQIAYPQEDMKWRKMSEHYDELINIAHQIRDGLLTVIPDAKVKRDR